MITLPGINPPSYHSLSPYPTLFSLTELIVPEILLCILFVCLQLPSPELAPQSKGLIFSLQHF